jgi:hypothetical protein
MSSGLIAVSLITTGLMTSAGGFSPAIAMQCGSFDEQAGAVTINASATPAVRATLQFISCSGEDILPAPDAPVVGVARFDLKLPTVPTVLNRPFDAGWDGARPSGYQPVVARLVMNVKDYRNGYFQSPVIHPVRAWVAVEIEDIGQPAPPQPHTLVLTLDGISDGRYLPGRHVTGRFTFDEAALTAGAGEIFVNGDTVNGIQLRNEPAAIPNANGPVQCTDGVAGPSTWRYSLFPTAAPQDQRVSVGLRPNAVCTDTLGLGIQSLPSTSIVLKAREDNDPSADDPGETPLTGTMNLIFDDGNAATPKLRALASVIAHYESGTAGGPVTYGIVGLIRKGPLAGASVAALVTADLGDCSPSTLRCTVLATLTPWVGFPFALE